MKRSSRIALLIAGLLAGWVASAGAGLPNLPPIPPLPTVPTLPVLPPPPRPPRVPRAPAPRPPVLPPVSHPSLPAGAVGGGTTSGSGSQATTGSTATHATPSSSRPAKVYRLHFTRDWIARTGPKHRRQTTLIFVLRKSALIEFVVVQVAPSCRQAGRFRVQGRPGVNRVRFHGRIGRRVLGPGTYRIRVRSLPNGRALIDRRLVIVTSADKEEIATARDANACGSAAKHSSAGLVAGSSIRTTRGHEPAGPKAEKQSQSGPSRDHGVLGARFTKKAVDAVKSIPMSLYLLLGLAIALLGLAALPLRAVPGKNAATLLAHQRVVFAVGGAATLIAVAVAYTMR